MALSKIKNNWFNLEINASDFMPDELVRIADSSTEILNLDQLEHNLDIIARKGAKRNDIGIPKFQNWFFTNHTKEWDLMTNIIDDMINQYIDENLKELNRENIPAVNYDTLKDAKFSGKTYTIWLQLWSTDDNGEPDQETSVLNQEKHFATKQDALAYANNFPKQQAQTLLDAHNENPTDMLPHADFLQINIDEDTWIDGNITDSPVIWSKAQ